MDADMDEIRKETGDLLLHMVFYAQIASETPRDQGGWDIADSLNGICDKLIDRHPHIYGDVEANDEETVKANWEQLKLKEGKKSVLEGVRKGCRAWSKPTAFRTRFGALVLIGSTLVKSGTRCRRNSQNFRPRWTLTLTAADEFGDVLFALVNYARFKDINPDEALERTNRRFQARFQHMESAIQSDVEQGGKTMAEMSLTELDAYWGRANGTVFDPLE